MISCIFKEFLYFNDVLRIKFCLESNKIDKNNQLKEKLKEMKHEEHNMDKNDDKNFNVNKAIEGFEVFEVNK